VFDFFHLTREKSVKTCLRPFNAKNRRHPLHAILRNAHVRVLWSKMAYFIHVEKAKKESGKK
jgi:hypothetical protein